MLALIMAVLSFSADELPTLEEVRAERCRRSLGVFVHDAWPLIEPATPYQSNWHLDAIIAHLQAVAEGRIPKLIINVPPGSGKSSIVSVLFPAWIWAREPHKRFLFASHKEPLALRDSVRRRNVIASEWWQKNFGPLRFADDANLKSEFHNERTGHMVALGTGGNTGYRGDYLCLDDPNNATEMESEVQRTSLLKWLDEMWSSRGNQGHREVVIQQRTHVEDTTGHLLTRKSAAGKFVLLKIPMEFRGEANETSIGYRDPRTHDGEPMWPAVYPADRIEAMKEALGAMATAGQFQQSPRIDDGGIFQAARFQYATDAGDHWILKQTVKHAGAEKRVLKTDCVLFQVADTALKDKQRNDWTVVTTLALTPDSELIVVDVVRVRLAVPKQYPHLGAQRAKWEPLGLVGQWVEDKASGTGIIQQGADDGDPIGSLKADIDKVRRAATISLYYENGRVYHVAGSPWLPDFENELLDFPNGMHDDQVDTMSHAGALVRDKIVTRWMGKHLGRELPRRSSPVDVMRPAPLSRPGGGRDPLSGLR